MRNRAGVMEKSRSLPRAAIFIFSFLLIFSRRPDAVLSPQFWAEDGKVWFQQAYNDGAFYALFTPEAGYFQTISRLVAAFAQIFPFEYAPLIFNFAAISVKIVIVFFLLSKRLNNLLPDLPSRFFAAFVYLALPHSYETHANLTNAQWHLAFLSCLIIIAVPATGRFWKIFDYLTVALSALSGPFYLLLLPVAALKFIYKTDKHTLILLVIIFCGSLIQGISLVFFDRPSSAPLGASVKLFMRIVGGHWFVASIFGETGLQWTQSRPFWKDGISVMINLFGFGVLIYAFLKSRLELRLLIIFAALIAFSALISPAISNEVSQWSLMQLAPVGSRYWLVPIFCFLVALFLTARNARRKFPRYICAGLLLTSSVGIVADWKYPAYRNFEFQKYAAEFNNAATGDEVVIPINPDWKMRLKKK